MNHLLASFFVVLVAGSAMALSDEQRNMFKTIIENCVAAEGATEQDVGNMINMVVPTLPSEMCLHACVMEATGIIVNGKFNAAGAVEGAIKVTDNNETKVKLVTAASNECAAKLSAGNPDRCIYARDVVECNDKAALALGMSQKEMLSP